ncbi:MAG: hypothetical protein AYK18_02110 [Theionarchaea archaeon DG-70]|nr:MAG: hypothetical protein AYK18_02110 [Theionarchaea archaeon DG-70]
MYAPAHSWLKRSLPKESVPSTCCAEGGEYPIISGSVPVKGSYISSKRGKTAERTAKTTKAALSMAPTFPSVPSMYLYVF